MDATTQGNLYLTGPGGNSGGSHGQTKDAGNPYYCDANKDKSGAQNWCPEIDLFEGNLCGFHSTWHGCDSLGPSDSDIGCDHDGKAGGGVIPPQKDLFHLKMEIITRLLILLNLLL